MTDFRALQHLYDLLKITDIFDVFSSIQISELGDFFLNFMSMVQDRKNIKSKISKSMLVILIHAEYGMKVAQQEVCGLSIKVRSCEWFSLLM